mmetsp:Transcript_4154/g.15312  ORF Transcript_4154/g.15312 Transcript_4154/m.15312 type:complete len:86 (-) Transcript_4154:2360-2617(-)
MVNCVKCGTFVSSKFCTQCGTPAATSSANGSCVQCHSSLLPGAKFCTSCGTPVASSAAQKACHACGVKLAEGCNFCPAIMLQVRR